MDEKDMELSLGDFTKEEAEKIAEENIGLIHHIINTLNYTNFEYDDLYGAGLYGYAKAIKSYQKNRNTLFSTYACNCIRNEILFFMKKELKHMSNNVSLNKQIANGDHKDLFLEDIIEDEKTDINHIEKLMINDDNLKYIDKALNRLNDEEKFVICHRYGLLGHKELKQKEIADAIDISQASVSKLERNSLKKLAIFLLKCK